MGAVGTVIPMEDKSESRRSVHEKEPRGRSDSRDNDKAGDGHRSRSRNRSRSKPDLTQNVGTVAQTVVEEVTGITNRGIE